MKKLFTVVLFVIFWLGVIAQTPKWKWVKSAGSTDVGDGWAIASDQSGNVYITGFFISLTLTFGTTTLTNSGSYGNEDVFIVKFDALGNVLWAKSAIGNGRGQGIYADASGNVYVTGYFVSPSITFGTITLTNVDSSNADIFVAKYDALGNVLWAKSAGGTNNVYGLDVLADNKGNACVTGSFSCPSISFGTITLTNTYSGRSDVLIVKYDTSGNVIWARSPKGFGNDLGRSISIDLYGNTYVTGYFESSSITFGTTALTNVSSYVGGCDIFIVKYNSSGKVLWAKSAGGNYSDDAMGILTGASGNVYITGCFNSDSIIFGTTTLKNTAFGCDIFVAKYDSLGNLSWVKAYGGTSHDYGNDISTDALGNIYVTGQFRSPSITFGTTNLINASSGYYDAFIVKCDTSGNILWAKSAGGKNDDEGEGVTTDAYGNTSIVGRFVCNRKINMYQNR